MTTATRIPVYETDVAATGLPPTRNATGEDFGAGSGLRDVGVSIQSATHTLAVRAAEDDVTNVRVAMAQARAEWDVHFKERAAASKPGDPTFAVNFNKDFGEFIDKQQDIAQTREGQRTYKLLAAELAGHFTEKAGIFQVQSAGVKAKNDWDVSQRAYATSVITDPTSYSKVLTQALGELRDRGGIYGRLDNNTREALETKARDTLAQSYINGLIDNGAPELARKILMDGKLDDQLEPKDKQRLVHSADSGIAAKRVSADHEDARMRRLQKEADDKINDELMGKFVAGKLSVQDVRAAGLRPFGEGSQDTWIHRLKTQANEWRERPIRTDPATYSDTLERMRLPYGDPRKIVDVNEVYKLYGKLSATGTDRLAKKLTDDKSDEGQRLGQQVENFIRGVKPQLDKSTMNTLDTGGAERLYQFRTFVDQKVDAARKANEDPRELLNPESPKYLGKTVSAFQTGPQRVQTDLSNRITDSLAKAKNAKLPGESPQQYLDRIKK